MGKKSGQRFERKVMHEFEDVFGWIVARWTKTVDFKNGKGSLEEQKYNRWNRWTGHPDFIAFSKIDENSYDVIGIEAKKSKYLSKKEKRIFKWLLDKGIMRKIIVAYEEKDPKDKRKRIIETYEFTN